MLDIPTHASSDAIQIHDIDTPVPQGLPRPSLWRCLVMPVGLRKKTSGGIILPDDTMDAQLWHHQLYKIAAVGPQVRKGPSYEGFDLDDDDMPKVGDLWLVDPKQPRRFGFGDTTLIMVNDDQLLCRVERESVARLKFFGFELG